MNQTSSSKEAPDTSHLEKEPVEEFFKQFNIDWNDTLIKKLLDDNFTQKPSRNTTFLAGGSIRRLLDGNGLECADLDFFFCARPVMNRFVSCCLNKDDFSYGNMSQASLTLYLYPKAWKQAKKEIERIREVQAVFLEYNPTPEHLLSRFNFTVNQFAYDGHNIIYNPVALWDMAEKNLEPVRPIIRPVSVLHSIDKYKLQGYSINPEVWKEIYQASKDNPEEIVMES